MLDSFDKKKKRKSLRENCAPLCLLIFLIIQGTIWFTMNEIMKSELCKLKGRQCIA